nr:hypothetical protein GCM10020092_031580 [Actinoplanes digitatis]
MPVFKKGRTRWSQRKVSKVPTKWGVVGQVEAVLGVAPSVDLCGGDTGEGGDGAPFAGGDGAVDVAVDDEARFPGTGTGDHGERRIGGGQFCLGSDGVVPFGVEVEIRVHRAGSAVDQASASLR